MSSSGPSSSRGSSPGTSPPDGISTARGLVERHAAGQSPSRRRALGSHATPEPLATMLVDVALRHLDRTPALVVDPACGAGSLLLAAADALVARGVRPDEVVGHRLAGCDVDPDAVAHCVGALRRWADEHGVRGAVLPRVVLHDPLEEATPFTGAADLVVGNPPFLAQRTSDTARSGADRASLRRRFGELGPYVDAAAAFLLVGTELLAPGGVAVLIEPQSLLAARDAATVRQLVADRADLVALWADDAQHFDADVEVCAPILRRRPRRSTGGGGAGTRVELRWGAAGDLVGSAAEPAPGASWAPMLAAARGVPLVDLPSGGRTIGDVASCTAGFRDEFYALASVAHGSGPPPEAAAVRASSGSTARRSTAPSSGATTVEATVPLVTVGMIDVCRLDRSTPRRLGGRRVVAPVVDVAALRREHPRVAAWVDGRRVPKVLVATQTKVVEAIADPAGELVPVTPVVSVEPTPTRRHGAGGAGPVLDGVDVWHLVAALSAPPVAASVAADRAGSGMSSAALRLSAASVRSLPLPVVAEPWHAGAGIARELHACEPGDRPAMLRTLGTTMCAAYGTVDEAGGDGLLEWWLERADRR